MENILEIRGETGWGATFFVVGFAIMVSALLLGPYISPELSNKSFSDVMAESSSIKKLGFFFFAFGFPTGIVVAALGARRVGGGMGAMLPVGLGILVAASAILVPILFGRETGGYYFGVGGVTIMISVLIFLWFWGQLRPQIPTAAKRAWDLVAAGGVCLAVAAWNMCGAAAMPSFLLFPEQAIAFQTRPFAVGQMKSVMAMLVAGWVCLALAAYNGARVFRNKAS